MVRTRAVAAMIAAAALSPTAIVATPAHAALGAGMPTGMVVKHPCGKGNWGLYARKSTPRGAKVPATLYIMRNGKTDCAWVQKHNTAREYGSLIVYYHDGRSGARKSTSGFTRNRLGPIKFSNVVGRGTNKGISIAGDFRRNSDAANANLYHYLYRR